MIRQRLYHRLQQLEVENARIRVREMRDQSANTDRAIEKFRLFLQFRDTEQGPKESLAEALARALGITYWDLRGLLAAGIDPVANWLTENGVYGEIERRKAAGTWPGGARKGTECQALIE